MAALVGVGVLAMVLLALAVGMVIGFALGLQRARRVARRQDVRPAAPAPKPWTPSISTGTIASRAGYDRVYSNTPPPPAASAPEQPTRPTSTGSPVRTHSDAFDARLVQVAEQSGNVVFKLSPKDAFMMPSKPGGRPC